jgi:hypothetical protein
MLLMSNISSSRYSTFTPNELLTKIINHTKKETDPKAPHPVIYGGVLNNLSQIFGSTQRAKMTGFLPASVSTSKWIVNCFFVGVYFYRVIHLLPPVAKLTLKIIISFSYFADLIYYS